MTGNLITTIIPEKNGVLCLYFGQSLFIYRKVKIIANRLKSISVSKHKDCSLQNIKFIQIIVIRINYVKMNQMDMHVVFRTNLLIDWRMLCPSSLFWKSTLFFVVFGVDWYASRGRINNPPSTLVWDYCRIIA